MRYSKFLFNVFILLPVRMEFKKNLYLYLFIYLFNFKIIHFMYLFKQNKLIKVEYIISIIIFSDVYSKKIL